MSSMVTGVASILIISLSQSAFAGSDYPNTEWMGGVADKNSEWYEECIKVKDELPPKRDLPKQQVEHDIGNCDPTDLYYEAKDKLGTGQADWKKVLDCAFSQEDGRVLMMLYANGFGVNKNVKLATKYACQVGGAPAEMHFRIGHLSRMSDATDEDGFDICDHATSGYMAGMCASFAEKQNTKKRNNRLAKLTAKWSPVQKEAYARLQSRLTKYADLVSDQETDASGTSRAEFMIEAEAAELEQFVADLDMYEKGDTPQYTLNEFLEQDKQLNLFYKEIMRSTPMTEGNRLGFTTVTKKGVKATQKAWLAYRDAWVAFGKIKYPSVMPESWKAHLTIQRIKKLEYLREVIRDGI